MAAGPALTGQVPRPGRPVAGWLAMAAGPGLVLTGVLALPGPTSTAQDVGDVPMGVAQLRDRPEPHRLGDVEGVGARPSPTPVRGGAAALTPTARVRGAAPVRLELPRFGVHAPIQPVGVDAGGALLVPEDPAVLGWWHSGSRPGDGRGAVVVAGHVDSARYGLGVFATLAGLAPGDAAQVVTATGTTRRYVVTGRRLYPKTALPTREVFSPQGSERLVLISCGGAFDERSHHYTHNVVVYAVPVE